MADFSFSGFINLLSQEKRLLQWLYEHPDGRVAVDNPQLQELIRNDKDRLSSLLQQKILVGEDQFVCLNPYLFFPVVLYLAPGIRAGKDLNAELVYQIGLLLSIYEKKAGHPAASQAFLKVVQLTGMLATSVSLSAQEAEEQLQLFPEKGMESILSLQATCERVSEMLAENLFFTAAEDPIVLTQIARLRKAIATADSIIEEAEFQTRDKQENTKPSDRIRKLKYLKDNQLMEEETNIREIMEAETAMLWEEPLTLNPLIETTDSQIVNPSEKPEEFVSAQRVSVQELKKLEKDFAKSDHDLYHFLTSHPLCQSLS
ncbi:MAG: hypothetical protein R3C61_18030, partial [Bacteroidia bacterium]